jgi:ATP-dependent Lon protease
MNGTEKHVIANYLEVLLELPWERKDIREELAVNTS